MVAKEDEHGASVWGAMVGDEFAGVEVWFSEVFFALENRVQE